MLWPCRGAGEHLLGGKQERGQGEGGGWTVMKGEEHHEQKPGDGQEPGSLGTGK